MRKSKVPESSPPPKPSRAGPGWRVRRQAGVVGRVLGGVVNRINAKLDEVPTKTENANAPTMIQRPFFFQEPEQEAAPEHMLKSTLVDESKKEQQRPKKTRTV